MSEEVSERMSEEKRDVTIRGLESEVYRSFSSLAKEMGKTVGELMNEAMKIYMRILHLPGELSKRIPASIGDIEELAVEDKDVKELGRPIIFKNIKKLTLRISRESLSNIIAIDGCEELVIPKDLPKLEVLSKCSGVKRISFLEDTS
jgi:radical SAM superfamily enzyme with C-terminal helix-hairpin-helix motif